MKYSKGTEIYIKPRSWFDANRGSELEIKYEGYTFSIGMASFCGKKATITNIYKGFYTTNLGSFPIAEWMIDMYTTDKYIYAKLHNLPHLWIDQSVVDKVNLPMDSNAKFTVIGADPDILLEMEETNTNQPNPPSKKKQVKGFDIVDGVRISKATGKPVRGYTRKGKESNSKPVSKPHRIPNNMKELEFGTKVIAYNSKSEPEYIVGRYEGSNTDGYLVRVSKKTLKTFKYIKLYKESILKELITDTFNSTDRTEEEFNNLKASVRKLVQTFEQKFLVKVDWKMDKYSKLS